MFVVELINKIHANSLSLAGESLDILGDSLVYSSSLFLIHRSQNAQARVSLLKGFIMKNLGERLLRLPNVLERFLFEKTTLSTPMREGSFPQNI
ncbi:hypothetical protein [Prochlorococcus marinus]|uniref:hypothetical protein n=1 Tax=Prochlorococcus marinus TaxID=1219 RepID=UPI0022B55328|nr:hypothetical protein [Prochlorococcus marinus]